MKTSIATVSITGTLPEKLEAIAAAGFDGVEIFENDFIYDGSPREIGQMCADLGIDITLFQPFRDFEGCRGACGRKLRAGRTQVRPDAGTGHRSGAGLFDGPRRGSAGSTVRRRTCAEWARGRRAGLRVGYEALAWGRHVNDHRDAWEIVRRADHPTVGLILDSFHTLVASSIPTRSATFPATGSSSCNWPTRR